jgi:hypothetical protein
MGNENSVPHTVVEDVINLTSNVVHNGEQVNPGEHPLQKPAATRSDSAMRANWSELFNALPLEILTSIFHYLDLNFKNVIGQVGLDF